MFESPLEDSRLRNNIMVSLISLIGYVTAHWFFPCGGGGEANCARAHTGRRGWGIGIRLSKGPCQLSLLASTHNHWSLISPEGHGEDLGNNHYTITFRKPAEDLTGVTLERVSWQLAAVAFTIFYLSRKHVAFACFEHSWCCHVLSVSSSDVSAAGWRSPGHHWVWRGQPHRKVEQLPPKWWSCGRDLRDHHGSPRPGQL